MTVADLQTDRFKGCLLGLAAGDALGTTIEFKSPGSFAPIAEMFGVGPFRHKRAYHWTVRTRGENTIRCGCKKTGNSV